MTKIFATIATVFLLSACTGSTQLLEKSAPQPVNANSLISPPWEVLVKAPPGAEKDIDLETLNGSDPLAPVPIIAPPQVVVVEPPAPSVPQKPKPGATTIRAVAVLGVTGASPQGNTELSAAMRKILKDAGWPVVERDRKSVV